MENLELINDIYYLTEKRNDELKKFNELIKSSETEERINNCFNSLLRKQKRVKLAEDELVVYNITKKS